MQRLRRQTRRDLSIGVALLLLLALTVALAHVLHGAPSLIAGMLIAVAKAGLVAVFFMELIKGSAQVRIFAAASLLWLVIIFSLTLSDYLTRRPEAVAPYRGVATIPAGPIDQTASPTALSPAPSQRAPSTDPAPRRSPPH